MSELSSPPLNIPPTLTHQLSSQLFKISVFNRRLFANAVEESDTNLMPESYVVLTSSHKVLQEGLKNPTPLMVMNKLIHQEIGSANLQKIT